MVSDPVHLPVNSPRRRFSPLFLILFRAAWQACSPATMSVAASAAQLMHSKTLNLLVSRVRKGGKNVAARRLLPRREPVIEHGLDEADKLVARNDGLGDPAVLGVG